MIYFPRPTKKDALAVARRITRWLTKHGCNQVITAAHHINGEIGWCVEIPSDIVKLWPSVADLATE